jgi:hypothetical protein
MKNGLSAATSVVLAAVACAQDQNRPNGFYLATPVQAAYGYDDNFVAKGQERDDKVLLFTAPSMSWRISTHRTRFSLDYEPEFEIFTRYRDLDAWNHYGVMRANYRINGRSAVDVGNFFLSTQDPSRKLENSLLLLPRGLFQQNAFYTELGYRYDHRTKFVFRLDNAVTRTGLDGFEAGKLNQVSAAGTASVERTYGLHHTLTAAVGHLWVRPFDTRTYGGASGVQVFNGGYLYTPNRGLVVRMFGGVVRGRPSAFTGAAAVEKKLGGLWVAAGYRRYLNFFGGLSQTGAGPQDTGFAAGLAPDSIFQVVSFRAWGNLSRRVALEASAQRALIGVDEQHRQIKGGVGQVRLDYKLTDRLTLFAASEFYGQNINQFAGMPLSRSRHFGGVKVRLSRPPETENRPNRRGPPPEEPKSGDQAIPEEK